MSEVTRGKSASLAALSAVAARGAVKAAEQLSEMLAGRSRWRRPGSSSAGRSG